MYIPDPAFSDHEVQAELSRCLLGSRANPYPPDSVMHSIAMSYFTGHCAASACNGLEGEVKGLWSCLSSSLASNIIAGSQRACSY